MRPKGLQTKIFLDSGNPEETEQALSLLGFLDGQTTNPSLISENPLAQEKLAKGEKFTKNEALGFYRKTVKEISNIIPKGAVSIEVYADSRTKSGEMIEQAREMFFWIPNAHIKFPTTKEGLKAAKQAIKEGIRANMTLCFSQEQAAAVYAATKGAKRGDIFVSPFDGRLDDLGESGISLIEDIMRMYKKGDGHVEVLAASIRDLNHLLYFFSLGVDIVTAPFTILKEWYEQGLPVSKVTYEAEKSTLRKIAYRDLNLNSDWENFNIDHPLTEKGIKRFTLDWNKLLQ